MNVLIAASYQAPQGGNFIPSVLELGLTLQKEGDNVFFIFPKSENTLRNDSWRSWLEAYGFTVYLIDKHAPIDVQLHELVGIIDKHNIHLLHTHFNIYRKLILQHRRKLKVKILVHDHFGFEYNRKKYIKQKIRNALRSALYRLLDIGVVAVNEMVGNSFCFARHWHVPNGLSFIRHVEQPKSREECRAMLGIQNEEKICLILGWSLDVKGLDIAVKAVAKCAEQMPEIRLCVVGFGSDPKEKVLDYIRERTAVDPRAPWLHYWDDTEDVFSYHAAADVYLSASRTEGFSYGVLEAISQNTPVVLSDIQGTQWAWSYDHAYPYPVENVSACAESIKKALCTEISTSNYQTIMEEYSNEKWCQRIISIYRNL